MQQLSFWGLCWNTIDMFISLPSDKLIETQQLAHALLQRQPVTVHQVMSLLGKTTLCAIEHAHLCWLCHVIQSGILNVYYSPAHFFLSTLLFQLCVSSRGWPGCNRVQSPLQFPLPDVVITIIAISHHWAFYIQGSGVPVSFSGTWSGSMYKVHIALQEI